MTVLCVELTDLESTADQYARHQATVLCESTLPRASVDLVATPPTSTPCICAWAMVVMIVALIQQNFKYHDSCTSLSEVYASMAGDELTCWAGTKNQTFKVKYCESDIVSTRFRQIEKLQIVRHFPCTA